MLIEQGVQAPIAAPASFTRTVTPRHDVVIEVRMPAYRPALVWRGHGRTT